MSESVIERDVVVGGVNIHYAEAGEGGPPIVLIHGLGSAGVKFYDALPLLAEARRTIAIDLPGFGRSDAPKASYSPAWQAGGVRAFLDALGIEQAVLVGNSYGGLVASYLAAAWPERCSALVLAAPALPNDGPRSEDAARFVAGTLPFVGPIAQRAYWTRDPAVVVAESLERNCVDASRVSPAMVKMLEEDTRRKAEMPAYRRAILAAQRSVLWSVTGKREETWRVLSSINSQTVLLWGADDRVVPLHVGRAAAERMDGVHLLVLDDCGHNPQMEQPERFSEAVTAFLRAVAAGSADVFGTKVELSEYDVRWQLDFETEREKITAAVGDDLVLLEHVGSTAVPGMAAKPIIDMCGAVRSFDVLDRLIEPLERAGYRYVPDAEELLPERRFFVRGQDHARTHHLHLYEDGDPAVRDYVTFRDALRRDSATAREYEQLKRRLAATLTRVDYTEAKAPFIRRVIDGSDAPGS